ncbi:hypothetical protein CE91St35_09530 [Eggerthella lenta]|nr:hypothetical protein CE91St34_28310 [Eggerthella lenta]GKG86799.1 hypothetical protein CE91St35_09530 [Eggerthella lenta]
MPSAPKGAYHAAEAPAQGTLAPTQCGNPRADAVSTQGTTVAPGHLPPIFRTPATGQGKRPGCFT